MSNQQSKWHLDKSVPLALMFTLTAYAGVSLWWAAKLDFRVINNTARIDIIEKSMESNLKNIQDTKDALIRIDLTQQTQQKTLEKIEGKLK